MCKEKCCSMCGKKVNWVAEVSIFPQEGNPDVEDFYAMVCYACLTDLPNNPEVKDRLLTRNPEKKKVVVESEPVFD